jgi:hypothetical protein
MLVSMMEQFQENLCGGGHVNCQGREATAKARSREHERPEEERANEAV